MNLSANFTLAELTKSKTAERLGIDNTPDDTIIENLGRLAEYVLQPTRDEFGPYAVSSGFRCEALEKAITWAGDNERSSFARWCIRRGKPVDEASWREYFSRKSHPTGQAADFEVVGVPNPDLAMWIRENLLFDQLILEFYMPGEPNSGWVHCSFRIGDNRGECLTINKNGVFQGLLP